MIAKGRYSLYRMTIANIVTTLLLQAVDVGGSMFVHIFGAFFGIACSFVLYTPAIEDQAHKEAATYDQDLFSMVGECLYHVSYDKLMNVGLYHV